jgi:hypothetical protein
MDASIRNSAAFISNYLNTILQIKNGLNEYDRKGKGKILISDLTEPIIPEHITTVPWNLMQVG